jgi:14-3-3 protein epsilon
MKGDYFRYIAEYASGDVHTKASEGALEAYKLASEAATAELESKKKKKIIKSKIK